jgi:hypothetical protein
MATKKKVVVPTSAPVATAAPQSNFNEQLLSRLVFGRRDNDAYYEHHPVQITQQLVAENMVELNNEILDENGWPATRATDAAMHKLLGASATQVNSTPAVQPTGAKFVIDNDTEVPERKSSFGGRTRESVYPFDLLAAPVFGQPPSSFHIPATEEQPDPARIVSSAVSAQNRKWAKPTGQQEQKQEHKYQTDASGKRVKVDGHFVKLLDQYGQAVTQTVLVDITVQERQFICRSVDENDKRGPGARVFRVK